MNLKAEEKELLERLGKTFFTFEDCAGILQIDIMDFKSEMEDMNSDIFTSYHRGYNMSQLEIRESIQKLASKGSAQAQKMIMDIISKTETINKI